MSSEAKMNQKLFNKFFVATQYTEGGSDFT